MSLMCAKNNYHHHHVFFTREWITTVPSWPPEFVYKPMKEIGLKLSKLLRDPDGEYRCDFIIALTHCR